MSHKPWRMVETNIGSTTMNQVMMDATKATTDMTGDHRHLQYIKRWPGMRSHKPWGMGETNVGLPTMTQVMMDTTLVTTDITGHVNDSQATHHDAPTDQGEVMMFH